MYHSSFERSGANGAAPGVLRIGFDRYIVVIVPTPLCLGLRLDEGRGARLRVWRRGVDRRRARRLICPYCTVVHALPVARAVVACFLIIPLRRLQRCVTFDVPAIACVLLDPVTV